MAKINKTYSLTPQVEAEIRKQAEANHMTASMYLRMLIMKVKREKIKL